MLYYMHVIFYSFCMQYIYFCVTFFQQYVILYTLINLKGHFKGLAKRIIQHLLFSTCSKCNLFLQGYTYFSYFLLLLMCGFNESLKFHKAEVLRKTLQHHKFIFPSDCSKDTAVLHIHLSGAFSHTVLNQQVQGNDYSMAFWKLYGGRHTWSMATSTQAGSIYPAKNNHNLDEY